MIETIYCIYDKEAGIALKPFLIHRNDVAPVREFQEVAQKEGTPIHNHASEFQLIAVAVIDLETLEVSPTERRLVATAIDLIAEG